MKILTWNINGIRSVKKDQSLKNLFESLDCDIICLQETKVTSTYFSSLCFWGIGWGRKGTFYLAFTCPYFVGCIHFFEVDNQERGY